MRSILNFFFLLAGVTIVLMACDKKESLPYYTNGSAPTLSASTTTIAPAPADSDKVALTLTWSNPKYATDSANYKYTIEIDSTGKNFANAATKVVNGQRSATFTAKELNNILLSKGYAFNVPVTMDVRLTSSYANNNERLSSNTIKIQMTPYKVPPKVALPSSERLFIVGSATQGGWNNPVPTPAQEFTRINETTYGGIFQLNGGQEYLLLPVNGDWSHKYSVKDNTVAGLNQGGDFGADLPQNIPGPTASGLYKIIVDFQTGKFTVTPFTQDHGLPSNLYIVGDATPGGWNNPVPTPDQQFNRLTSTVFELPSIALSANKQYLLLPNNGDWSQKFGSPDNSKPNITLNGPFVPEGQNIPGPTTDGNYKVTVDFLSDTYTLTKL